MTDRSKLKLHPGSRWNEDASITDQSGDEVCVYVSACGESSLAADDDAYIEDALAVIRDAGLDPEFEELEEARTEIERLKTELDAANGHVARLEERIASEHKRAVDFARRLRDINDYIEGCLV